MPSEIFKRFLPPGTKDDARAPEFGLVDNAAWAGAAAVMGDVWRNEETRFSNLNGRAVAVLSATSLVTTVLGFYSNNVLDTAPATRLGSTQQAVAKAGLYGALALLLLTAAVLVFGVLLPGKRFIFGANPLTGYAGQDGWHPGSPLDTAGIDQLVCQEYGTIYVELANRSRRKAYWLQLGYLFFTAALLASMVAAVLVIHQVPPAP